MADRPPVETRPDELTRPSQRNGADRSEAEVAVVGAGPVGLAMALGLARYGIRSVLLEKKETTSETSRAPGVHVRTLEVLRQWGLEERFRAAGVLLQPVVLHSVVDGRGPLLKVDFSAISDEADRPGLLILQQSETEKLLLDEVRRTEMCDIRFGAEVVAVAQDAAGARLTVRQNGAEHALKVQYAVGCDGASSFVRDALGLPFPGTTYALRPVLADIRVEDDRDNLPFPRAWTGAGGYAFAARLQPGLWRLVHLPRGKPEKEEVPEAEVRDLLKLLMGPGPAEVVWASRFRIHVRASPRFRVGRVLLAGDAAHVHSPASGFGMNGGIHDAHNLAWKLAYALRGGDVDRLLDSYEVERRAVVVETSSRRADRITRMFIEVPAFVREAALLIVRIAFKVPRLRRSNLRRVTMIDLRYPKSPILRSEDPAAGVRLPNPTLLSSEGRSLRLYDLLTDGPAMLHVSTKQIPRDDLALRNTIRIGPGGFQEPTGVLRKLLGGRDGWILVRPDTYIAWTSHDPVEVENAVAFALGMSDVDLLGGVGAP